MIKKMRERKYFQFLTNSELSDRFERMIRCNSLC